MNDTLTLGITDDVLMNWLDRYRPWIVSAVRRYARCRGIPGPIDAHVHDAASELLIRLRRWQPGRGVALLTLAHAQIGTVLRDTVWLSHWVCHGLGPHRRRRRGLDGALAPSPARVPLDLDRDDDGRGDPIAHRQLDTSEVSRIWDRIRSVVTDSEWVTLDRVYRHGLPQTRLSVELGLSRQAISARLRSALARLRAHAPDLSDLL